MAIQTKLKPNDPLAPYKEALNKQKTIDTSGFSQGQMELYNAYGVAFDQNGLMTKGNATDRDYELAAVHYAGQQEQDILARQAEANAKAYEGTLEDYRLAAERQKERLALQRNQTRRETSVMTDKLTRYLPYLHRQEGITGSGLSETSSLSQYNAALRRLQEADNAYSTGVQGVEDSYLAQKRALDQSKLETDTSLGAQRATATASTGLSLAEVYGKYAEREKADAEAASMAAYTGLSGALATKLESLQDETDGKISAEDYAALKDYADEKRETLNENDRLQLDMLLDGYASLVRSEEEQAESKYNMLETGAFALKTDKNMTKGDNLTMQLGLDKFAVQVAERIEGDDEKSKAIRAYAENLREKKVFIVEDELYVKMPSNGRSKGVVVRLEKRALDGFFGGNTHYNDLLSELQKRAKGL